MKKLDGISNKLITIEKEANNGYDFYKMFLAEVTKEFDKLKDDTTRSAYLKSSENFIISRIKYYLNCEKSFLIYNYINKQIKKLLNFNIILYLFLNNYVRGFHH